MAHEGDRIEHGLEIAFMRHGQILLTGEVDDLRAERNLSIDQLFREVYR